ncbi:MAG: RimK family alpha-L-glutamate ligase [Bdellovibrio sp.]|nr:RimK family alpha-L-glutamate ligase [Methylotenera sp.]
MQKRLNIVIFTDEPEQGGGWHGAQLALALAARGFKAIFVSLQDCVIDCSAEKPIINIPHVDTLPKAAFVRGIAGGTFQQITQRLNILHALKLLGVIVYNDGRAIERTVDKAMTSFLLHQAGIATPKTWVCESRSQAHAIIEKNIALNQRLVIKPMFGSQGRGVRLIDQTSEKTPEKTPEKTLEKMPLPMDVHVDGVFYLQQFIKSPSDYRVFIVNNQVVAAMKRIGETWLHNAALGAKCDQNNEHDVAKIALQAALVLEIAYCGVDVIRDEDSILYVLEVNSIPAWRGLQSVSPVNIAQELVDDFLVSLNIGLKHD